MKITQECNTLETLMVLMIDKMFDVSNWNGLLRFRDELPDVIAQPKFMTLTRDKERKPIRVAFIRSDAQFFQSDG
uniref:Uncharacterized protein n=1 Tax=Tanacetum cinerariifolium TaxID=118510 RepID=A0A699KUX9_TANCI|nr:hypothetical protein [Tanacetum cinerariifolium]